MPFTDNSVNISICQFSNCAKLEISDACTDYDTGTLLINGDAVTAAVLTIDGVAYDVFSIYSAAVTQDDLVYTTDDVLAGASVTDGFHTIVYELTAGGTTYTMYEKNLLYYCSLECCVYNMIANIPNYYNCNKCDKSYIENALTAWGLLLSLRYSMECGDVSNAEDIFETLKLICDTTNCNCNN
jgi:hypothetical protein